MLNSLWTSYAPLICLHLALALRQRRMNVFDAREILGGRGVIPLLSLSLQVRKSGASLAYLCIAWLCISQNAIHAQSPSATEPAQDASTSTDLFVMAGSDFDRPGLLPRANYNIGIGHTVGFLHKDPLGDELTFGYTYENSGNHGFLHTGFGEHTESVGIMKNFPLPATKLVTGYTWIQTGITSYTGHPRIENRLDSSFSLGAIV